MSSLDQYHLVLIEPCLSMEDELHLLIDNDRTDDEDNGSSELKNDQTASEAAFARKLQATPSL